MNTQYKTLILTSILALTILANINIGSIYATGNLDDEEEEAAIEELQNNVQTLQESFNNFELNLTAGPNNIQANCPITEEKLEEVQQNITEEIIEIVENVTETETEECPLVPAAEEEEEQNNNNQSSSGVIPPFVVPNEEPTQEVEEVEEKQNVTEIVQEPTCQPITAEEPEPEEQNNETISVLEPILCPINGELLGYTNTTSGEQLPVSAGNQTTVTEEEIQPVPEEQLCEPIPEEPPQEEQPTFNTECFCFELNEQTGELNVNSSTTTTGQ